MISNQETLNLSPYMAIYDSSKLAYRKRCSVRKRSVSNKCFICAKAKRQQQSE
ncbi:MULTISPECIES: hypothetical protein [Lysinibacillus]|uniref:hypothetical protein n=1 Tax=Lysinibacillus TaxID=400634 RepID=UPI001CBC5BCC|nr:hypothetical protein [Lysinibacillus sphaericus]